MKNITNIPFLVLIAAALPHLLYAQKSEKALKLIQTLQAETDSAIIYYPYSTWDGGAPHYYILTKTQVKQHSKSYWLYNAFTYINPYKRYFGYEFPNNIHKKIYEEYFKFATTLPDTNRYFLPYKSQTIEMNRIWEKLISQDIWNLLDDMIDKKLYNTLDDGAETCFFFVTKNSYKKVYFYGVNHFYNSFPNNTNLKKIASIIETWETAFKN